MGDGLSFFKTGRLMLVPATALGCVSDGYGFMEQLIAESANCVPTVRHSKSETLPIGLLPYSPHVPLTALVDVLDTYSAELRQLRSLLINRTTHFRNNGFALTPKALELEIADTLTLIQSQYTRFGQRNGFALAEEQLDISSAPFRMNGGFMAGHSKEAFSPLLRLQSLGYGWQVSSAAAKHQQTRFRPAEGEAIGAWLTPAECGVSFPMVAVPDE